MSEVNLKQEITDSSLAPVDDVLVSLDNFQWDSPEQNVKNEIQVNLDFQAYDCGEEPSDESEHIPESIIDDSDDDLPPIVDNVQDDVDGDDEE